MIYRVVLNDSIPLYGLDIEDMILNPSLEVELNSAGSFSFTLSAFNSSMKENWGAPPTVLAGEIDVYEDDTIIWFGRPLEIGRDWNNNKVIKCEGALAYFNDTVLRPKEFDKNWWLFVDDDHDKGFFNYIIEQHNAQVTENHTKTSDREILVGDIIGIDNDNIYRQTDYNTVADALQQMCLDTNGGYFILRKEYVEEEGIRVAKRYIDWVKEPVGGTDQVAQFARNMVDLSQDLNGSDVVTVLIPTGEDDILINNSTVWDDTHPCPFNQDGFTFFHGSGSDELVWKEGYAEYGRILKQKDWNDISDKSVLQQRACEWIIDQMTEPVTIECTAADLHYINDKDYMIHVDDEYIPYMPFFLGQKVEVLSQPHGMIGDGPNGGKMVPIYKISINLDSGVKKMSIGTPPKRELTDIIKASGGSTRSSSSGTSSGGGSGSGGGSVTIPVKDVRVKKAGEEVYKSVVKKKIAKIDLSDLGGGDVTDVTVDGSSVVDQDGVAKVVLPLTDVQIDDVSIVDNKIANIDSSQFGTTVVANPSGTPTDDLTSIKIGSTVYDIPGGGGGGGGGKQYTCDLLFENDPMPAPQSAYSGLTKNYTLDNSIDDYDAVYILGCTDYSTQGVITADASAIVFKKDYYSPGHVLCGSYTDGRMLYVMLEDDTHIRTTAWASAGYCPTLYKIYGLKFAASVINNPVSLSDYYDTTEQVVGRWTDGKPLYQKSYLIDPSITVSQSSWTVSSIQKGDIENIISSIGYQISSGWSSLLFITANISSSSNYIRLRTNLSESTAIMGLTLQYTKTTDIAGTGPVRGTIIQRSDIYSTEERQIGRWTDGKPLYQITIHTGALIAGVNTFNLPSCLLNRDTVADINGTAYTSDYNGQTISIHNAHGATAQYYVRALIYDNDTLSVECGSAYPMDDSYVTITYTKTTDIAGTGLLPDEPTHIAVASCYSEEEQVVGRWTDGKPLYQKSFTIPVDHTHPNETYYFQAYAHGISNVDVPTVKVIDAQAYGPNQNKIRPMPFAYGSEPADPTWYSSFDVDDTNIGFEMGRSMRSASDYVKCTLQYTKTTDVPNTGPIVGNLRYLPTIYSEQEHEIGVWTDGKPLYQKVVNVGSVSGGQDKTISFTGIETVVSLHGVAHAPSYNRWVDINYPTALMSDYSVYAHYNDSSDEINVHTGSNFALDACYITIQYTKTTDTPGSGTWTPEGQLAHHYSTSEHIVGTWIDGSTIYERTWDFGSDINVPTNWISTSIPNTGMSMCIACEAVSNSCIPRANIEAQVNSGSYVNLSADSVANPVRYLTLRYTKT